MTTTYLDTLRKKYKICNNRVNILHFEVLSRRYNSRLKFLLNKRDELHLNNCVWSQDDAKEGPDTCPCYHAKMSPEKYLEDEMLSKNFQKLHKEERLSGSLLAFNYSDQIENVRDFYKRCVSDRENVFKWYEEYKTTRNAIQFEIKVREMGKQREINVILNPESREWHLTDCIRCVFSDEFPNTCYCQKALMDPAKYLREKYNFIEKTKEKIPYNYLNLSHKE